jgi:two-component system, chemotaxis family, chemotaxis protein CheY
MDQVAMHKVLVVEDEVSMRKMMAGVLQQAGFVVTEAANGKEGKEKAVADQPDAIVTDNMMPIMNGVDMISEIRQSSEWGSKVPIVLMTNVNDLSAVNKSLQSGGVDYLMKSDVQLDDIVNVVKQRLGV